jgi:hypothetical protein
MRFELLGEFGIDSWAGVGSGLFSGPGADGDVSVYGVRAGLSYRFRSRRGPPAGLGLWVTSENDATKDVGYSRCGLFNCSPTTAAVGTSRVAVLLGGAIDLGPL